MRGLDLGAASRWIRGGGLLRNEEAIRRHLFFYVAGVLGALAAGFVVFSVVPTAAPRPAWVLLLVTGLLPTLAMVAGPRVTSFPPAYRGDVPYLWLGVLLVMFAAWSGAYVGTGLLSRRLAPVDVALALDGRIPFQPVFVFLYVMVFPLFLLPFLAQPSPRHLLLLARAQIVSLGVSYVLFFVVPVHFPHPVPPIGTFLGWSLAAVYGNDTPSNCFPSTHCSTALVSAFALAHVSRRWGAFGFACAGLIALSTVMIRQHYVIDIVAGFAIAAVTWVVVVRVPGLVPLDALVERVRQLVRRRGHAS